MSRHAVVRLAALVAALTAWSAAPASAQNAGQRGNGIEFALTAGVGGAFALAPDNLDRDTGPMFLGGIELRHRDWSGIAGRLALRIEGGFTSQGLASSSSFVDGDVQTVHAAALLSLTLIDRGRFEAYALAGPTLSRLSTNFELDAPASETPGSAFNQTTHESAPGLALGVGAGWRIGSASVRVETRWMSAATTESTTMVPVVLSLAIPLHR